MISALKKKFATFEGSQPDLSKRNNISGSGQMPEGVVTISPDLQKKYAKGVQYNSGFLSMIPHKIL